MKILVTGAAGFIGANLCEQLLKRGDVVVGIDNINDYYDPELKYSRLNNLGVSKEDITWFAKSTSDIFPEFEFIRMNLEDKSALSLLFSQEKFDIVCNLAAQAGVRYSITNPEAYINSNIVGFLNVLEACRHYPVKHLVYASSSSVYGLNESVPFSEKDSIAHPVSLYAATKKSNELMAHAYSNLYNICTTGLRFFTVYGPWGRPDMAPFIFMKSACEESPIKVFNHGDMLRDFTYIDDIVEGVIRVIDKPAEPNKTWNAKTALPNTSIVPYRIYNIGNSNPVRLMDFISEIEVAVEKPIQKIYLPMQPGDVYQTNADTTSLENEFNFKPATSIKDGIKATAVWFKSYYKK